MLTLIVFIFSIIVEICVLVMMLILYYRIFALVQLVLRHIGKE